MVVACYPGRPRRALGQFLNQAHASAGDLRRRCDAFGLALRPPSAPPPALDHPGLVDPEEAPTPHPDQGIARDQKED
jgi:hypothetical protein